MIKMIYMDSDQMIIHLVSIIQPNNRFHYFQKVCIKHSLNNYKLKTTKSILEQHSQENINKNSSFESDVQVFFLKFSSFLF